jgi:hypothetical protein
VLRDAARGTVAAACSTSSAEPAQARAGVALLPHARRRSAAALLLAERSPAGVDLPRFAINLNLDDEAAQALWHRVGCA